VSSGPSTVFKLNRAIDLYETIHEESARFIEREIDYDATPRRIGTNECDILTWKKGVEDDPRIGVLVGEFVHDVRSGLDQLIYALVVANEYDPGEHTQYPIYDNEPGWVKDVVARDPCRKPSPVHGLNDIQLDFIRERQPYCHTKKRRARHPLMKLLRMSNVDKHQTLHTSAVQAHAPSSVVYEPPGFIAITKKTWESPTTIVEAHVKIGQVQRRIIKRPPPDTKIKLRIRGIAEMVFSEEGKSPIASVNDLGLIIECAREILYGLWPGASIRDLPSLSPD